MRCPKRVPGRAQVLPWIIPGVLKPSAIKLKLLIGIPPQKMFAGPFGLKYEKDFSLYHAPSP